MVLNYNVGGIDIVCDKMTLPIKKGLASSAAICLAVIRSYNLLYGLGLSIHQEMELAYKAERSTGSKCGKLDQLCAYGKGIRLVSIDGENVKVKSIIPMKSIKMILVDLEGSKDTKRILDDLNAQYPFLKDKSAENLYMFLGPANRDFVFAAMKYIESGSIALLGKVLNDYQTCFDESVVPYSSALVAPLLHGLINDFEGKQSILACKGVGSQGDGTAQLLVSDEISENEYKTIIKEIKEKYGYQAFEIIIEQPQLHALVPIAGKGSRLWPYTKCVPKAFLPIFYNKKLYPLLYIIGRELYESGVFHKCELVMDTSQIPYIYDKWLI